MRGFTLVELMVAVSIIAVLSTVGVTAFSKAQVKARDTARKNNLRQIQTALDLYYEDNHEYPRGDGISSEATCYPVNIPEQLRSVPKDPQTGENYCYQADLLGKNFNLWAKLENTSEGNITNDTHLEGYNYFITGNETFLAQKSNPPPFTAQAIRTPSITAPAPINRVDQSSCLIWINGNASSEQLMTQSGKRPQESDYPFIIGGQVMIDSPSVAISSTLPGNFNLKIRDNIVSLSGKSSFTNRDVFIYSPVGIAAGESVKVEAISTTNAAIKCSRYLKIDDRLPSGCTNDRRGGAIIRVQTVRETNFNPDNWPIYKTVGNSCLAVTLPDTVFKKFTAFVGKTMSSVKDSFTSTQQQPAVLGITNECRIDQNDGPVAAGECDGDNPCLNYTCGLNSNFTVAVCNTSAKSNGTQCGQRVDGTKAYCVSSECSFDTCVNDSDCIDHEVCTIGERCNKPAGSSIGVCVRTQQPTNTVCATQGNQPTMLCSGGTNSQCNVPYAQCTKASESTATCCGTTNIQVCRKSCEIDGIRSINDVNNKPGVSNIATWITDACGRQYTYLTDGSGVMSRLVSGNTSYRISYGSPRISTTRFYGARVTIRNSNIDSVESFIYSVDPSSIPPLEANFGGLARNAEGIAYYVGIGLQ